MSSVIVLSSSPLRTFARSPTRVEFSSPQKTLLRTDQDISRDENIAFKASETSRDGFSSSFRTAKEVLAARPTAENIPIDSSRSKVILPRNNGPEDRSKLAGGSGANTGAQTHVPSTTKACTVGPTNHTVVQILPGDSNKKKRAAHTESLNLQKAAIRRKQLTPVKSHDQDVVSESAASSFGLSLATSFGHSNTYGGSSKDLGDVERIPTKKRKLDVPLEPRLKLSGQILEKASVKKSVARSKSPVKKGLTITGLATSHYADRSKEDMTPMMQYLVSTQAMMDADVDPETFETNIKKSSKGRKSKTKSRLRSPDTAMKSLESQEIIFATASQLAREDSPTLLRDTVEAMKQSQEQYYSSPICSQHTAGLSVQSVTPQKTGLLRFRGRKSLWSAGDRDEHNALLHVDDDVADTGLKEAFVGTDALVEDIVHVVDQEKKASSMNLLATLQPETSLFDIDDLPDSPPSPSHSDVPLRQRREYSTAAAFLASERTTGESQDSLTRTVSDSKIRPVSVPTDGIVNTLPSKPNYAAWGDDELKEACQIHGLKRLRARKSMIDKLDERWAEHHGIDPKLVKAATKRASKTSRTLQPGDFLGKVHGLAERPVLKAKKLPKKRKENSTSPVLTRQSSPAVSEDIGRIAISDTVVLHNISGSTAFDRVANIEVFPDDDSIELIIEQLEPSTAPSRGTGVKAAARRGRKPKAKPSTTDQVDRPPTPPPTIPDPIQHSSPGFENPTIRKQRPRKGALVSPNSAQKEIDTTHLDLEDSLRGQIRKALMKNADDTSLQNHYEQPSFLEKIQMYDPIVLEEFTAWLNTEGFNAVGEDREIDANEVRDWCHDNGVCCLWKGGWRGNKKKEKGEE